MLVHAGVGNVRSLNLYLPSYLGADKPDIPQFLALCSTLISNNLKGTLPASLGQLTTLTQMCAASRAALTQHSDARLALRSQRAVVQPAVGQRAA